MKTTRAAIASLVLSLTLIAPWHVLRAQRLQRLSAPIDARNRIILRGSRNPRIEGLVNDGAVPDSMRVSGITLRFKPTYDQSLDLERLLEDQQNPESPLFHRWLTPEQYAERFGLAQGDFDQISAWISSQGFHIDHASRSHTYISFSGTAAQVRDTFGTELRRYTVDGRRHFANEREVIVPAELEPLIATLRGLDDFRPLRRPSPTPRATNSDGAHALSPGDLAVIYNAAALHKAGITGKGQRIAVAGASNFKMDDVRQFRAMFGLPKSDPKLVLLPGEDDPGIVEEEVSEALLDVEWAGALAPNASIVFVYGSDAWDAAAYAIDQNIAPVVSLSYGGCEAHYTDPRTQAAFRGLAQQASTQGITWIAASGDAGAADCDDHGATAGVSGIGVDLPASVPEITAVGGTEFSEGTGKYWSTDNQNNLTSALSYIPEKAWNDTVPGKALMAGGGGTSIVYPKPSWQTGPGVPNDNARHVPDISLTASWKHDPYLIFWDGEVVSAGGTSASAPLFAGALALLNQYVVDHGLQDEPGLGNINPRLYQLAQTTTGVFHDITVGDIIVPCKAGTRDCTNGAYGYKAGPGYDQATGLGSIDIAALAEKWSTTKGDPQTGSKVVITVDPSPVYQQEPDPDGYTWFFTVRLAETAGTGTLVGGLWIDDNDLSPYTLPIFGDIRLPANGTLSGSMKAGGLDVPSDHVIKVIGVDADGRKWSKQVTVQFLGPKTTSGSGKTAAMSLTSDPAVVVKIGKGDPDCAPDYPYGQTLILKESNGSQVNLTKFLAGGFDFSNQIATWFGSQTLPGGGSLKTKMCWQLTTLPTTLSYEVDGVDATGKTVQATLKVDFKDVLDQKSGGGTGGRVDAAFRPDLRHGR
jgi:hypothetical protein